MLPLADWYGRPEPLVAIVDTILYVAYEVQPEIPAVVETARHARAKLAEGEKLAEQATVTAARELLGKGYTVRDAGKLPGISPQRV